MPQHQDSDGCLEHSHLPAWTDHVSMKELLCWNWTSSNWWPILTTSHETLTRCMRFVLVSERGNLLDIRCCAWDLDTDTTPREKDQLLPAGKSWLPQVKAERKDRGRGQEPPSSSLTLIRFARRMSSAVMVLCVGTTLSSCCCWSCSGWPSGCWSSADCVSGGTGVCSCCSSPFSVVCPASSNCPLLEKCSKSWNRKSYS